MSFKEAEEVTVVAWVVFADLFPSVCCFTLSLHVCLLLGSVVLSVARGKGVSNISWSCVTSIV